MFWCAQQTVQEEDEYYAPSVFFNDIPIAAFTTTGVFQILKPLYLELIFLLLRATVMGNCPVSQDDNYWSFKKK